MYLTVRFLVLMASMKIRAFWDELPYSLIRVDRRFKGHRPDDGGSTHL
jgi:hypothetical protein